MQMHTCTHMHTHTHTHMHTHTHTHTHAHTQTHTCMHAHTHNTHTHTQSIAYKFCGSAYKFCARVIGLLPGRERERVSQVIGTRARSLSPSLFLAFSVRLCLSVCLPARPPARPPAPPPVSLTHSFCSSLQPSPASLRPWLTGCCTC